MHADVYWPIWLQLGMMKDTAELYVLILAYVTLTLNQGQNESKTFCSIYLAKSLMDLDGI